MAKQQTRQRKQIQKSTDKAKDVKMFEGLRGAGANAVDEIRQGGIQGLNEMRAGFETAWEEVNQGFLKAGQALFDSLMKAKNSLFMQNRSESTQAGSSYQQ